MVKQNNGVQLQLFLEKMQNSLAYCQGNASEYHTDQVTFNPESPLSGKKLRFLVLL